MEETWSDHTHIVRLDEATISEMIRPALGGKKLAGVELLTAGHANTNYKLRFADIDEAFVLKLYTRHQEACLRDVKLFEELHATVPMAEIIYAQSMPDESGWPYTLTRWVEGSLLDNELGSPNEDKVAQFAYDIGATLAVIGQYRFPQPGLFDHNLEIAVPFSSIAQSWYSFLQNCLFEGNAGWRLGKELTEQLWALVEQNMALLTELPVENALVQADFKGANILVAPNNGQWRVAAVLDWEFAYAGSPLSDVATLLRHSARYNPAFEPNFARGFVQHGGQLSANWKLISRLLDLLNLCDFLNRSELNEVMRQEVTQLIIGTINSQAE